MPDANWLSRTHVAPRAALHKTFAHLRACLRALG
jgi:hypothetical protein